MNITRRALLAATCGVTASVAGAERSLFQASSINHVSLTVPDVAKAGRYYERLLGARVIRDMGARGQMRGLHRNYLAFFQGDEAGLNHFSPGVDGLDEPGAGAVLKANGYDPFERAPGIWACLDPDGNQNHLSETMRREDQVAAALKEKPNREALVQGVDVNHVALKVSDVGRAIEWYQGLMGLNLIARTDSGAYLGLGANFLELRESESPGGAAHVCFSVDDYDPSRLMKILARHEIPSREDRGRVFVRDLNGITVQLAEEGYQPEIR